VAYEGTARQLAPVNSGYLRGSIQITPFTWTGNNGQGSVGPSRTKYAAWMEEGTGIYGPAHTPIVPKTKPMLAWYAGGKWHFAKSVRGSKPRWYMKDSLEANQGRTEANFQMALDSVAAEIAGRVGQ